MKYFKNKESVDLDRKRLEREVKKVTAAFWEVKGVYANALTQYLDLAKLNFELGYDWGFEHIHDSIATCLRKSNKLYSWDVNKLTSILDKANEKYPKEVKEIRDIIKDMPKDS